MKNEIKHSPASLLLEELEERVAPSVTGTGGYDGQPGNQSSSDHNPSGSANPEGTANPENSGGK
ncbi:MAG: hypothetical protein KG003_13035 [Bacteroidetes bacterium]|nr:hypothetical protein [Bacteroidota bacterium]